MRSSTRLSLRPLTTRAPTQPCWLSASALSSAWSMSAVIRLCAGVSVKVRSPAWTVSVRRWGATARSSTRALAASTLSPPTSTPPTRTPLAIWSRWPWS